MSVERARRFEGETLVIFELDAVNETLISDQKGEILLIIWSESILFLGINMVI